MLTYDEIKTNKEVNAYLKRGAHNLNVLGFTDHSNAHTALVAIRAGYILQILGYSEREVELAKIAGYMHDIGNAINRKNHAEYGAILADNILRNLDVSLEERMCIISAIGHHDESTGRANDAIGAALIIADKTDVRRNRVIVKDKKAFDIHDHVNYAVTSNRLDYDPEKRVLTLALKVDENFCTMYEYFDIFLNRMLMSRKAAEFLDIKFSLKVNGTKIL